MKEKVFLVLRKTIFHTLGLINFLFYKSNKKIFIDDTANIRDNHRILFEYLVNNGYNKKYKIIYFVTDKNKADRFKYDDIFVTSSNIIALYHHLTSKYVFFAFGMYRFNSKSRRGQKVINLWHGSPLKSIGYMTGKKMWYKYEDTFTQILVASEFFRSIYKESFGCSDSQIVISGNPRNDLLFSSKNSFDMLGIDKSKYSKTILFMPTFRNSKTLNAINSTLDFPILTGENIRLFNEFLKSKNMLVIIKPHHAQRSIEFLNKEYSNIIILYNDNLEKSDVHLYELLGQVDALLTDYSSVYFDFLLNQKPIGFVLDDIDEYGDKRGFAVEDPLKLMPGEKIYNEKDLIKFIVNICNGVDNYEEERTRINDLVNKYQDNKNCERILDFLGIVP
jgi:CDP-glycerol glycerophosphotransferase (TagB/SpsB family)